MTKTMSLGAVSITRVMEWEGLFAPMTALFPDSDEPFYRDNEALLAPHHYDPPTGLMHGCLQTFVLRSEGRTILVDTGAGDGKERPYLPIFGHLQTGFLDRLAEAGVQPADVDLVINTHVHIDHVGWNTYLHDREWVPTFPNATYLFSKVDFEFWNPLNGHTRNGALVNQNMFEDSVAPVAQAGQANAWDGDSYRVDGNLTLELAPGHTPGLSVLKLESEGDRAVFVGDLLHSPTQVLRPDWNSCFCEDPAMAAKSRRSVLGWAAAHHALLFPAHWSGHHGAEIEHAGDDFAIKGWAPFAVDPR
jgi:glyoxylase-like metal-dependent hydrolase (beta-lactamase superfamily II)